MRARTSKKVLSQLILTWQAREHAIVNKRLSIYKLAWHYDERAIDTIKM